MSSSPRFYQVAASGRAPVVRVWGCTTAGIDRRRAAGPGRRPVPRRRRAGCASEWWCAGCAGPTCVRPRQQRPQRRDCRRPVTTFGFVLEQFLAGQVELDVNLALLVPCSLGQSDRAEHELHRVVASHGLGNPAMKPGRACNQSEVLRQHRGNALVLVGVSLGERDVCFVQPWTRQYSPTPVTSRPSRANSTTRLRMSCPPGGCSRSSNSTGRNPKNRWYVERLLNRS